MFIYFIYLPRTLELIQFSEIYFYHLKKSSDILFFRPKKLLLEITSTGWWWWSTLWLNFHSRHTRTELQITRFTKKCSTWLPLNLSSPSTGMAAAAWMDDYGWWQEVFCRWGMNPNFSDVFVTSQWSPPHQIVNMNNINNNIRKTKTQKKSSGGEWIVVVEDGSGTYLRAAAHRIGRLPNAHPWLSLHWMTTHVNNFG